MFFNLHHKQNISIFCLDCTDSPYHHDNLQTVSLCHHDSPQTERQPKSPWQATDSQPMSPWQPTNRQTSHVNMTTHRQIAHITMASYIWCVVIGKPKKYSHALFCIVFNLLYSYSLVKDSYRIPPVLLYLLITAPNALVVLVAVSIYNHM